MTERAKDLMNKIWESRNSTADTEEKLVSSILRITSEMVKTYQAQNNLVVLDKNDLLELANELENVNESI